MTTLGRISVFSIIALVLPFLSSAQTSSEASCGVTGGEVQATGTIWCGVATEVDVHEVAIRSAPVLWFSPDENLYRLNETFPSPLPFDGSQSQLGKPVVYFSVQGITTSDGDLSAPLDLIETIDLRTTQRISIAFFFYYTQDFGFGGHPHDLEFAVAVLEVDRNSRGCVFAIRIRDFTGGAHGSSLYANRLHIDESEGDFSFPITILVEEGKHASATDRNGDGHYTPGYDVNRYVADAWGVRDTLRVGNLVAPRYNASMTKQRVEGDRVGPEHGDDICLYVNYRPRQRLGLPKRRYSLKRAPDWRRCVGTPSTNGFDLCRVVRRWRLGEVSPPPPRTVWQRLTEPRLRVDPSGFDTVSLTALSTASTAFLQLSAPPLAFQLPKLGGWVVPKLDLIANIKSTRVVHSLPGASLLFTPSASRWLDWFSMVSIHREEIIEDLPPYEVPQWMKDFSPSMTSPTGERLILINGTVYIDDGTPIMLPQSELRESTRVKLTAGYKIRFVKWERFFNATVGVQWNGLLNMSEAQGIIGFGIGPW